MKQGTGIGTGTRMGYGAGVEYMATGVGVYIGTGQGRIILFGSQFSSTQPQCTVLRLKLRRRRPTQQVINLGLFGE